MAHRLHGRPDGNTRAPVSSVPGATSGTKWHKALSIYMPWRERSRTTPATPPIGGGLVRSQGDGQAETGPGVPWPACALPRRRISARIGMKGHDLQEGIAQRRLRLPFHIIVIPSTPAVSLNPCCTDWRLMTTPW